MSIIIIISPTAEARYDWATPAHATAVGRRRLDQQTRNWRALFVHEVDAAPAVAKLKVSAVSPELVDILNRLQLRETHSVTCTEYVLQLGPTAEGVCANGGDFQLGVGVGEQDSHSTTQQPADAGDLHSNNCSNLLNNLCSFEE